MLGGADRKAAPPQSEVAAAYLPVVRGFLITTAVYYSLITASHPFYETGFNLVILGGLAVVSASTALFSWFYVKRGAVRMLRLELVVLTVNALFIANTVAYLGIHFEPLKLVYFVLMAVAFAIAAPTRRVAYVSVAAAGLWMLLMARKASGDLIDQYAFVALAGGFAALGLSGLIRGAVMRELKARLASEALNRELTLKLEENQRLQAEAQELAAAAQAANRAKTEFLATISHEIRTPLNGVLGMSQAMEQRPLNRDQRGRLAVIQASAHTLLDVVNDVLDISKIEAGKMDIVPTTFSLDRFAEAMRRLYETAAQDKGLAFSIEIDPAAAGWRFGDEVRLRQVLSNLISNAIKFTEAGSIHVLAMGGDDRLTFSVSDTGVGIPPERRERIFEKFVQVDGSTTRRVGGAGLGLAICREIVGLMGGAIAFETVLGLGSRFEFEVPFARSEPPEAALGAKAAPPQVREGLRLLVVDDNATNRAVLQTLLSPLGAIVESVCDGVEAVAAWEAAHWDVILMDIHMPEMDGLQASRIIRAREAATGRPRTPLVAVTASVLAHETAAYFSAGMDDVVAKPIDLRRLIEAIQAQLGPGPSAARSVANG